jgi:hypothetical protein
VLTFIKDELLPGSIVSIDSFPWALKINVDSIYELAMFEHFFRHPHNIQFINSIFDLSNETVYDNLLLCGISSFKYKKWQDVVNMIVTSSKISQNKIIIALPITLLFFHRLKYSYDDIINKITREFSQHNLACTSSILDIDIVYFSLSKT